MKDNPDIIGINESGHDVSLSLIRDNKISFAIEEERLTRIKHHGGLLLTGKCNLDIGRFVKDSRGNHRTVSSWDKNINSLILSHMTNKLCRYFLTSQCLNLRYKRFKHMVGLNEFLKVMYYNMTFKYKYNQFLKNNKIKSHIDHHRAHAASAYRCSAFKRSNVLAIDGSGEYFSSSIYDGNKSMKIIRSEGLSNSLGYFYGIVSGLLKMGVFGEGKTMGLSAYGNYNKKFENLIILSKNSYKINISKVRKLFRIRRRKGQPILNIHKDLAFMAQKQLEEAVMTLIDSTYEITGNKNWCIAGGVGLNCLMNSKILNHESVKNIFVQPASNDAGCSLGAALEYNYNIGGKPAIPLKNVYLGTKYSNKEIKEKLIKNKLKFTYYEDIAGIAAEKLAKNKVICWFQGRMEFGPRALGNRSILANPSSIKIKNRVNDIKNRERWRPLAPSILEKDMRRYYYNPYKSPFMNLSFQTKEDKKEEIAAVVHVDGSARVQTVNKKDNGLYYDLINKFKKETGTPILLNTSFNNRSEPIVMTPQHAINTFINRPLDYLVIGNFLVSRE